MKTGESAPTFTLTSTTGRSVSIDDYLGQSRVLLLFYPTTYKGCCGDRLGSDVILGLTEQLAAVDTEPIAMMADGSMSSRSFLASLDLPYPVLVDGSLTVFAAYDATNADSGGPQRHTTIVGRDGRVHFSEWGSPSPESLLELLGSLDDEPVSYVADEE